MKHTSGWWANRKIGVSIQDAVSCCARRPFSYLLPENWQCKVLRCFALNILLLQINLQSLPNVFLCLHECLDRNPKQSFRFESRWKPQQQYQQQQKWMEEMSKWCDVVNGFDEAQVCLALGDYLNCKIHTCLGGKSVKDGIKVMKSGGSTELPSEWQMLSQFTWWYQVIQKKIWGMWGRSDHNAGVHIISGTPGRVLFLGDFPVEVVDPVEIYINLLNFPTKWSCHEVLSMIRQQHLPVPWMTWRCRHVGCHRCEIVGWGEEN